VKQAAETVREPESPKRGDALRFESTGRALRHRNFQLFFAGQLISLIGTWMQSVAQAWLVYRLTGSGLLLGAVGFSGQIPVFLLAPIGGIVADRWDRRRIVIATQVSSMILAFVLALLTLLGRVHVWHVFVLAALLGVVNAFDLPGRQSFLVEMVGKEDLMNAIALNSSMFNGARILGPAVAGILVAKYGEGWCFFANGASYIAVIVGLLMMRIKPRPAVPQIGSPLEHILEGFRFVDRTAPIKALLYLLGIISLVGLPYTVLMPIFADKVLHTGGQEMASLLGSHDLGAVRLGILMGATGVGALMGALTLAARTGITGLSRWIAWACGGFGVSLILFSFSKSFWLSVALLVPVGYCMMLQTSSSNTLIQAMVPDALRGRVMAVYAMMLMGMAPIGAFFGGALADRLGAPITVGTGAVACVAAALWFGSHLPRIRVEGRRLILAQGMAGGEPPQEMQGQVFPD
jgi:MFS family permease